MLGSGKSTLLKLLLRINISNDDSVKINGIDINLIDDMKLINKFSCIDQNVFVLSKVYLII
ncbi:ATP-binding cassette domain-containing protein [Gemella sp. zg-570]|uniref:ATP-binding cassette domain-containing protein n=1 Tax=unclassified Gemella TaxID=2624949 RepID=UPI001C0422AF|nr:ATP-binding cassette domain-containing protein [Gemella sp. zg-1178]QWQ38708.1 ATP-binding cassette domain-containing protein [Gemella sp. zg-570]